MELTAVRHFRKRRDVKRFVQMFEDEILQPFENARVQETVPFRLDPHRVTCGKDIDKLARIFPLAARDDLQRPRIDHRMASQSGAKGGRTKRRSFGSAAMAARSSSLIRMSSASRLAFWLSGRAAFGIAITSS